MAFKLKSGNKPPFKMMGSSPVKNDKSYEQAWDEYKESNRLADHAEKFMTNFTDDATVKDITNKGNEPEGFFTDLHSTREKLQSQGRSTDFLDVGFEGDDNESTKGVIIYDRPNTIHKITSEEDSGEMTGAGVRVTRRPMPPQPTIEPITPEFPDPILEPIKPRKYIPNKPTNKRSKSKKAKKVRRPKVKKTRNLVTGGTNKIFRSTGTSRRKNRLIAGLTFWNPKD